MFDLLLCYRPLILVYLLVLMSIAGPFSPTVVRAESPDGNTWLQWRGPTRDGEFYGPKWPADLSSLKETWRVALSESYSGPIVTQSQVLTTETRDRSTEVVQAFDRTTGRSLWQQEWAGAMKVPFFAASNGSWIRSTPACDLKSLYVGGIREVLVSLDLSTGNVNWRLDCPQELGTKIPTFGFVCSPLLDDDHVYAQAGSSFIKVSKKNGKIVWRSGDEGQKMMMDGAFSSPIAAKIDGQEIMFVQTRLALKGFRPADGEELFSQEIEAFRGMNILTPTLLGDSVFTSAHSGRGELFKVVRDDGGFELVPQWANNKMEAYMSSPVVVDDHIYLLLKNQRFACFDARTGEEKWRSSEQFGKYWSILTQGDRLLALDERGDLLLIRANPEKLEVISKRHVSDSPTWAHLAAAGNEVFVRELNAMAAYRWSPGTE